MILNTPADPARTCAIANVGVKGVTPDDLAKRLLTTHRIWTNAVDSDPGVHWRPGHAERVHPARRAGHVGQRHQDDRTRIAGRIVHGT